MPVTDRQLIVIRHTKAGEGAPDRDRPLTDRGHADARAVGAWLAARGVEPDRVVVSPARRTVQTWEGIAETWATGIAADLDTRIYDNSAEGLLSVVRESPETASVVVLVGHNPGVATLADLLSDGAGDPDAVHAVASGYPTGCTAVFSVPVAWSELGAGGARLDAWFAPGH